MFFRIIHFIYVEKLDKKDKSWLFSHEKKISAQYNTSTIYMVYIKENIKSKVVIS